MRGGWILGSVCLGLALAPDRADACSYGSGPDVWAPAGDEHPANAAILLFGSLLDPADLTATLDGEPIALVIDEAMSEPMEFTSGWRILALRLDPPPEPGQAITVSGGTCGEGCVPIDLAFVAGPPDLELSAGPAIFQFDLARYAEPYWNSCGSSGSAIRMRTEIDDEPFFGEELAMVEFEAIHAASALSLVRRFDPRWVEDIALMFDTDIVGDAFPIDGWCVNVYAVDPTGNRFLLADSCEACGLADAEPHQSPSELEYDPIPGGPCDDGSATTTSSTSDATTSADASTGSASSTTTADPSLTDTGPDHTDDTHGDDDGGTTGTPLDDDGTIDRGCACNVSRDPRPSTPRAALTGLLVLLALPFARRRR